MIVVQMQTRVIVFTALHAPHPDHSDISKMRWVQSSNLVFLNPDDFNLYVDARVRAKLPVRIEIHREMAGTPAGEVDDNIYYSGVKDTDFFTTFEEIDELKKSLFLTLDALHDIRDGTEDEVKIAAESLAELGDIQTKLGYER